MKSLQRWSHNILEANMMFLSQSVTERRAISKQSISFLSLTHTPNLYSKQCRLLTKKLVRTHTQHSPHCENRNIYFLKTLTSIPPHPISQLVSFLAMAGLYTGSHGRHEVTRFLSSSSSFFFGAMLICMDNRMTVWFKLMQTRR